MFFPETGTVFDQTVSRCVARLVNFLTYCSEKCSKTDNSVKLVTFLLSHPHTMTPFDAPGKQTF